MMDDTYLAIDKSSCEEKNSLKYDLHNEKKEKHL